MQTPVNYDELPEAVRNFVHYKQTVQGRSQKTMDEYALDLRTFFRFLKAKRGGENISALSSEEMAEFDISDIGIDFIDSVSPEEIYEFFAYVHRGRDNDWSARARKLSAIKGFYKYLTVNVKLTENNPAKDIDAPQKKKTLPKFLTLEESEALLEAVRADGLSKTRDRDSCMLVLFLNCGMRLSELVGINISDIEPSMESIRVVGKGSKERIIYLNDACREALRAYLLVRASEEVDPKHKNALFLSSRHVRISNKTVQWVVYKYLQAAGLEYKHFSTHKLRHTAATLMYQSGQVDVRVLKDILGHEQLNTTQIYTHVSDENMKRAIAANPLANFKAKGKKVDTDDDDE